MLTLEPVLRERVEHPFLRQDLFHHAHVVRVEGLVRAECGERDGACC